MAGKHPQQVVDLSSMTLYTITDDTIEVDFPKDWDGESCVAPFVRVSREEAEKLYPPKEELVPIWDNDFNDIQEGEN